PAAPAPAAARPAPAPELPAQPGPIRGGRLELFQMLEQAIKANVQMHRALVIVMVDAFAQVEERLGYHESELALAQLAELIKHRLSPKESLYRFSTALIAIVVSRPSTADFETLAEALRSDVAAHVFKTDNYEAH